MVKLMNSPTPLDRAHTLRRDAAALAALAQRNDLAVLPFWRGLHLMTDPPGPLRVHGTAARTLLTHGGSFLGLENGAPLFTVDLSAMEAGDDGPDLGLGGHWGSPRIVGGVMVKQEFDLLCYARGLLLWQQRTRFCPACGGPLTLVQAGHVAKCGGCDGQQFPRTDPAIIVLVEDDGERVLLGRQPHWPPGMYSCLAGFVEPGETLEQAVAREVTEEAGIRVLSARYVASQPWPFPASLMLGFNAQAEATRPVVDGVELEDARWFRRDEVSRFGEWGTPGENGLFLPRSDSISRTLIDAWITRGSGCSSAPR
jgi:NAD+ diphosphatase